MLFVVVAVVVAVVVVVVVILVVVVVVVADHVYLVDHVDHVGWLVGFLVGR